MAWVVFLSLMFLTIIIWSINNPAEIQTHTFRRIPVTVEGYEGEYEILVKWLKWGNTIIIIDAKFSRDGKDVYALRGQMARGRFMAQIKGLVLSKFTNVENCP